MIGKKKLYYLPMLIKYLFSLVLIIIVFQRNNDFGYFCVGFFELIIILSVTDLLIKHRTLALIINDILIFVFNIQMIVLIYSNSFISMVMLTNIKSIQDIGGKAVLYIISFIVILGFSIIPVKPIFTSAIAHKRLSVILAFELVFTLFEGNNYSPLFGYGDLLRQYHEFKVLSEKINYSDVTTNDLFNENIANCVDINIKTKNAKMPDQPNVILIFVEGLSQNVISDNREIMHNVKFYQDNSLSFINYYNHTFATYRGIIGQLFSGYQLSDLDSNSLISIQSILSDEGYKTAFINVEPHNNEFSTYLGALGFDELITDENGTLNGMVDSVSDKDAFSLLFKKAEEYNSLEKPFFLSMYTFGTHATLDSPDEVFEDGSDPELNKFYNLDYWFGDFMTKFTNSDLFNNTIIVFTADHATYKDDSFTFSFPDYNRDNNAIDEIPFFIFYNGNTTGHINAGGRNSLDLAPTILDFIDVSAPNYFLGNSLFSDQNINLCEYIFTDSALTYSTQNGMIRNLTEDESEEFNSLLQDYYITNNLMVNKED